MPESGSVHLSRLYFRLLLPFEYRAGRPESWQSGAPAHVERALRGLRLRGTDVWLSEALPHSLYSEELLDSVRAAVFHSRDDRYWRVDDSVLSKVVQPDSFIDVHATAQRVPVSFMRNWGIELFLSRFGFGTLSIALEADLERVTVGHGDEIAASQGIADEIALRVVYGCSQIHDQKKGAVRIRRPHPLDDAKNRARLAQSGHAASVHPPREDDAPLEERLGKQGASFTVGELARWLVPFEIRPFQVRIETSPQPTHQQAHSLPSFVDGQFNVYCIVRAPIADTDDAMALDPAGPAGRLVADLSQLQEPEHAGNDLTRSHIEFALLNRNHIAASTTSAAVHLVRDQRKHLHRGAATAPHQGEEFNEQRPHNLMSKYFIPALIAHHQRRHAESTVSRAGSHLDDLVSGRVKPMDTVSLAMTSDFVNFEGSAVFPVVSNRHVVNVWYDLCRRGERAQLSLRQAGRVIRRVEDVANQILQAERAKSAATNIAVVAHVQHNLEWIEIFVITVYVIELVHAVGHGWHFAESYLAWSLVVVPTLVGIAAFGCLRPDTIRDHMTHGETVDGHPRARANEGAAPRRPPVRRQLALMVLLGVIVMSWFMVGWLWFSQQLSGAHAVSADYPTSKHASTLHCALVQLRIGERP